jgi:uncharacterized membrane protein SirB2
MMEQIKLFFFVLSIIYTLRFFLEFVIKLTQENPEQMKLNKVEDTLLLISLSYIITYILI